MSNNFLNELISEVSREAEKNYYRKKRNYKKSKKNSSKKRMNFDQWRASNNRSQVDTRSNNDSKNYPKGKEVRSLGESEKNKEKKSKEAYSSEVLDRKKTTGLRIKRSELKKAVIYSEILGKAKAKR